MHKVEIFLPISRSSHLQALFNSLETLDCDPQETSLLAYVDGDKTLFELVLPLVEGSKFQIKHCIPRPQPKQRVSKTSRDDRRLRIAAIWNEARELLGPCKYVMGIEDDTIVPSYALERLLAVYGTHPHAGLVEGVELGRWGISHVGAWLADDVYDPKLITSTMPPVHDNAALEWTNIAEIDAGGFYCYLTKREHFVGHAYKPYDYIAGPDMEFGFSLRQQGYKNYIDWSVQCTHLKDNGDKITLANTHVDQFTLTKRERGWRQSVK
jgi:hypothetical protein